MNDLPLGVRIRLIVSRDSIFQLTKDKNTKELNELQGLDFRLTNLLRVHLISPLHGKHTISS